MRNSENLSCGSDTPMAVNTHSGHRRTPWHTAIEEKNLTQLQWLINKWPDDIDISGGLTGETPLAYACYRPPGGGFIDGVRLLLEAQADVHADPRTDKTPLHFAAQFNNLDICDLLLEHGADPTQTQPLSGKNAAGFAHAAGFKELSEHLVVRAEDYKRLGPPAGSQPKYIDN